MPFACNRNLSAAGEAQSVCGWLRAGVPLCVPGSIGVCRPDFYLPVKL